MPVAANPQGTAAFVAGANEGVSSVVGSTLIVLVSPAPPLRLAYREACTARTTGADASLLLVS